MTIKNMFEVDEENKTNIFFDEREISNKNQTNNVVVIVDICF